jgi:hypothetical protein
MKMPRAVRCRVTAAQQLAMEEQRICLLERENSPHRISHHCAPNLLLSQKPPRAKLCSTAPAMNVVFVSQAWSGTGTRFGLCRFPVLPPRTHNDSRPQSRSRLQSQQWPSASWRSYQLRLLAHLQKRRHVTASNRSHGVLLQIFSSASMIGAIAAEGTLSGGTTSGTGPVETGWISGCSIRVAITIAVKSKAPARK